LVLPFAILLGVILVTGMMRKRGRLQALAELPVHRLWLVPVALALQLPLFLSPAASATSELLIPRIAFIASYLLLGWVVWANRHLPGLRWLAIGVFLNGLVIVANGGGMPIAPETVIALGGSASPVGIHDGASKDFVQSIDATRLWFLSDILAIPRPFPWPVAFSIGDIFIVVGVARFSWSDLAPGAEDERQDRTEEGAVSCTGNTTNTPSSTV
jgi:hypothetical protein